MFLSCSLFPSMSSIIFHAFVVFILQQVFLSVKPTLKKSQQKFKNAIRFPVFCYDFLINSKSNARETWCVILVSAS